MKRSLLLYDSGIGGLSIYQELIKINPNLSITYIADTGFFPLGEKSFIDIQERCKTVLSSFFNNEGSLVVLACNTATVTAIRELQSRWLPLHYPPKKHNVLGVSTPLIELMLGDYSYLKDQKGVILSTHTTHKTGFYQAEMLKHGFRNFESIPAPHLASSIESGNTEHIIKAINDALSTVDMQTCTWIALACTHYHHAKELILELYPHITVIDPTQYTAHQIHSYLEQHTSYMIETKPIHTFYHTGYNPFKNFGNISEGVKLHI